MGLNGKHFIVSLALASLYGRWRRVATKARTTRITSDRGASYRFDNPFAVKTSAFAKSGDSYTSASTAITICAVIPALTLSLQLSWKSITFDLSQMREGISEFSFEVTNEGCDKLRLGVDDRITLRERLVERHWKIQVTISTDSVSEFHVLDCLSCCHGCG
jgi:hypothetical protein